MRRWSVLACIASALVASPAKGEEAATVMVRRAPLLLIRAEDQTKCSYDVDNREMDCVGGWKQSVSVPPRRLPARKVEGQSRSGQVRLVIEGTEYLVSRFFLVDENAKQQARPPCPKPVERTTRIVAGRGLDAECERDREGGKTR